MHEIFGQDLNDYVKVICLTPDKIRICKVVFTTDDQIMFLFYLLKTLNPMCEFNIYNT